MKDDLHIGDKHMHYFFCQTLGKVLRLRVEFVLPLSQQEQEQEEEQPLTKIYQQGVY